MKTTDSQACQFKLNPVSAASWLWDLRHLPTVPGLGLRL